MRINIVIDDKLMEEALKLLVQVKKQSRLKSLRGKLKWEGNLDEMRMSKWFIKITYLKTSQFFTTHNNTLNLILI